MKSTPLLTIVNSRLYIIGHIKLCVCANLKDYLLTHKHGIISKNVCFCFYGFSAYVNKTLFMYICIYRGFALHNIYLKRTYMYVSKLVYT